jgi:hypothetical protein
MRSLARTDGITVERMLGVYQGREALAFGDVEVLPVLEFFKRVHAGEVF